ncbi:MAG: hypothetical protein BMS9Abin13_247 [Patescibacteria group bacterium]|nr:MAG: hypothetical protein BMS9Abin13_247 [Patescibacteria group bacterium]
MGYNKPRYIIGIDEVGRGPIAGPVAAGAVVIDAEYIRLVRRSFARIKDSKKLSPARREWWFGKIAAERERGRLDFAVSFAGSKMIDRKGISYSLKKVVASALSRLPCHAEESRVLLDGGLRAPAEYGNQTTIIKGDEKEIIISMASIVAKVTRDRKMVRIARKYTKYDFGRHKGYGTRQHYAEIEKHGLSDIHRTSFLWKFLESRSS